MPFRKFAGLFRLHFVSRNDDLGPSAALGFFLGIHGYRQNVEFMICILCGFLFLQIGRAEIHKRGTYIRCMRLFTGKKQPKGDSGVMSPI